MDRRHLYALLLLAIAAWSASPASGQQPVLPTPDEGFEAWCKCLQDAEPFVPFQCAVELARVLFKVPASVVPPPAGPPEQTIEGPRKPEAAWESTLTVRRADDGSLQELSWYERREGWGRTVLARRVDADFVETSEVQFAD